MEHKYENNAHSSSDVYYIPSFLSQTFLPIIKPKEHHYVRYIQNGRIKVTITSSDPKYGLPFGSLSRLLLIWLCTKAVYSKNIEIDIGSSKCRKEILDLLRINKNNRAKTTQVIGNHIMRIFHSKWTVRSKTVRSKYKDTITSKNILPIKKYIYNSKRTKNTTKESRNKIILTQDFFKAMGKRAVPIKKSHVLSLLSCPSALDIYTFLNYRLYTMKFSLMVDKFKESKSFNAEIKIPWDSLQKQFGYNLQTETKLFKYKFIKALNKVLEVEPSFEAVVNVENRKYFIIKKNPSFVLPVKNVKKDYIVKY